MTDANRFSFWRQTLLRAILTLLKVAGYGILFLAIFFFCVALWTRFNPIFINTSQSLPLGIYVKSNEPIEKGAYVAFCPPDSDVFTMAIERGFIDANNGINNGRCDSGYGLMLKQVVAVEGDLLSIDREGVIVNDQKIPNTKQLETDSFKQVLPALVLENRRLFGSEVLLLANFHPKSFDGRYFGVMDSSMIVTRVKPWIIVFNE